MVYNFMVRTISFHYNQNHTSSSSGGVEKPGSSTPVKNSCTLHIHHLIVINEKRDIPKEPRKIRKKLAVVQYKMDSS